MHAGAVLALPTVERAALPPHADVLLPEPEAALLEQRRRRNPEIAFAALGREVTVPSTAWRSLAMDSPAVVWQLSLRSVGAAAIAARLHELRLPPGDTLRVFGADRTAQPIVYTGRGPLGMGSFTTRPVAGDRLVLEWHSSAGAVRGPVAIPLRISHLSHFMVSLWGAQTSSSSRLVTSVATGAAAESIMRQTEDIGDLCAFPERYRSYREQSAGVALLLVSTADGDQSFCSGTLLESRSAAGGHYVLTAAHCLANMSLVPQQWQARDIILRWHYLFETGAVGRRNPPPQSPPQYAENCREAPAAVEQQGLRLVAWDFRFDYALLRPEAGPPASVRPQPWTDRLLSEGDPFTGIHYPRGNPQRLSSGTVSGLLRFGTGDCERLNFCDRYSVLYGFGGPEPGSSGSAMWARLADGRLQVAGILSTGTPPGSVPAGVPLIGAFGLLHYPLQLDERLRLALMDGEAYFADCGPAVTEPSPERLARCGRLSRQRLCSILDVSAEGCDTITAEPSFLPAIGLWSPTNSVAWASSEALTTDLLPSVRAACIELSVRLPQRTTIGFRWRISSEPRHRGRPGDPLRFYVDGRPLAEISGELDWQRAVVAAPGGEHSLRWCYEKDATIELGSDRAWLDALSLRWPALHLSAVSNRFEEGGDAEELLLLVPADHVGSRIEIELVAAGTAVAGVDYTLAAGAGPGMLLRFDGGNRFSLSLDPATTELLALLLRPRPDDRSSQGDRSLVLGVATYRSDSGNTRVVALPSSLNLQIGDDEPAVAERISVNLLYACAVLRGGSGQCWPGLFRPYNDLQLLAHLESPNIGTASQVAAGLEHVCWQQADGRLRCDGSDRQFFDAGSSVVAGQLRVPAELADVVELTAGWYHNCVRSAAGKVICWGSSIGEFHGRVMVAPAVVQIVATTAVVNQSSPPADLPPAMQVSAGAYHNCALLSAGGVRCWGDNRSAQLDVPLPLARGQIALQRLEAGGFHNCALSVAGNVYCWGDNEFGQSEVPADLAEAVHIAVGRIHSCALLADGSLRCWGDNRSTQLEVPPLPVGGVAAVAAGYDSSCALLTDGSLRCWGGNFPGELAARRFGSAVPARLRTGDIAMSLVPRRLRPGDRAAIRLLSLRDTSAEFAVRIELFADDVEPGVHYRLVNAAGSTMTAAADGSYLLTGASPQAFVEAVEGSVEHPSRLYIRPLELSSSAASPPTLRLVEQSLELLPAEQLTGTATVVVQAGVKRLISDIAGPVSIELELSADGVEGTLSGPVVVQLLATVVSGGSLLSTMTLEIIATAATPGTAAVMLPLDELSVTTVVFSVARFRAPTGVGVELVPNRIELIHLSAPPPVDVSGNGLFDVGDAVLIARAMALSANRLVELGDAAVQMRLRSLLPVGQLDLRLDFDGDLRVSSADSRFLLRYLAGLRGSALGRGGPTGRVELLFAPDGG